VTAATTIVHRYGVEFAPSHVVLAGVLLALLLIGIWLHGVHHGRTTQDPDDHPLLDVSPQQPAPVTRVGGWTPPRRPTTPRTYPYRARCARIIRARGQLI